MIWCIKTYIIAYVKIQKKWRYTIHYVKPTAQLLFKIGFQKDDQHTGGKWLIHDTKRRKDDQLQSLKLPCRISPHYCKQVTLMRKHWLHLSVWYSDYITDEIFNYKI